jgi:hypothetical protein
MILLTTFGVHYRLDMFRPLPSWLERLFVYHEPTNSYRLNDSLVEGFFVSSGDVKLFFIIVSIFFTSSLGFKIYDLN